MPRLPIQRRQCVVFGCHCVPLGQKNFEVFEVRRVSFTSTEYGYLIYRGLNNNEFHTVTIHDSFGHILKAGISCGKRT